MLVDVGITTVEIMFASDWLPSVEIESSIDFYEYAPGATFMYTGVTVWGPNDPHYRIYRGMK